MDLLVQLRVVYWCHSQICQTGPLQYVSSFPEVHHYEPGFMQNPDSIGRKLLAHVFPYIFYATMIHMKPPSVAHLAIKNVLHICIYIYIQIGFQLYVFLSRHQHNLKREIHFSQSELEVRVLAKAPPNGTKLRTMGSHREPTSRYQREKLTNLRDQ